MRAPRSLSAVLLLLSFLCGVGTLAAQDLASPGLKASAPDAAEKSLANGLYLTGPWTAVWSGNSVAINVADINNDSFTRTTGSLRLELWATTTPPARAGSFSGFRLAVGPQYDPLVPRTFYSGLSLTTSFSPPPDGTYWLVLSLAEFNSTQCPASDPWCINADSINSDSTTTFGAPVTPPAVRAALENPNAGSFQSGIGVISGWSCQGPITVQVDGKNVNVPYGGPRGDTTSLCGGSSNNGFGVLVNYNNFGAGNHSAQLFVNGTAVGAPVFFTVTVPSGEFMTGVSRTIVVADFPSPGRTATLVWQQSLQNFVIQSVVP